MILTEITKAPTSFETTWSIVNLLRRVRDAPVDLWGCDKVVDTKAEKGIFEFQTVVAAMLSSQTKDRYVKEAMDNLIAHDLSLAGVLAQTEDEIDAHIKMVLSSSLLYQRLALRLDFTERRPRTYCLLRGLLVRNMEDVCHPILTR